jgi:hypothetical protein
LSVVQMWSLSRHTASQSEHLPILKSCIRFFTAAVFLETLRVTRFHQSHYFSARGLNKLTIKINFCFRIFFKGT